MGLGSPQRLHFCWIRLQFLQTEEAARLAQLRCVTAFIVALFAEMYGFPLTIYLLSGWLGSKFPNVNLFGHEAGHLWWLFTGQHGDPHGGILHLLSLVFIGGGFWLLSKSWHVLYQAQHQHELATVGPYRLVRHPQYIAFVAIMFGFLLQWPTILTAAMFPVLVIMYVRLAISEERESETAFGEAWRSYAASTPRFIPQRKRGDHDASISRSQGR